jgi:hypothetical protein
MSEGGASEQEQLEAAERRLDRLLDWVGRSDTKFSVVLGVDAGMLGFLATSAPAGAVPVGTIVVAALAAALLVASLVFIYRGTYPRTKGPDGSLVHFGSVAGEDREDFKARFRACDAHSHLDDVLGQMHRNAEILDRKFVELRRAYRCLLVAVIPWAITLYLFGIVPPPT